MANYDDIVEQHKRSLTKAQIKALADASQKYSILSAKSRAEAQTTARGQYDSGYRALQNMGLAGASGAAPASGEVPRLRTNIESSLDQFNQSLANVEHQRLAQLGAAFAKQTRANRAAEAAAQQQQAAQDTLAKQMQRAQAVARATGMKTLASVPKLKAEDLVMPSVKEFPQSQQDMYKASVQQRQGQIAERQAEIQRAQAVAAAIGMKTPASLPARKASDLTTPSVYEQPEKPAPKTAPQTEAASEKTKERASGGKPAEQAPAFTMQSKTAMPYTQYEAKQQATKWASMITEGEEKPKTVAAPDLTAEPKTETKPESYSSKKKTLEDLSALVKQYEAAEEKKQKYADTKDKEAYYDEMKSAAEKELTGLGYSVKTARQVVEQGIPGLEKREPKQEVATSAKDRLDALLRKRMEKDHVTDDELEKAQREVDAEAAEEKRKKLSDPAYIKYFTAQKEYNAAVRQQEEGYKQAKEKSEAEQKNLDAVKEIYRKYEAAEARFFYGTDTPEENDLRASQMQSAIEELQSLGYTLDSAKQLIDTGVTEPKYEESPAVAEAREKLYWAKMEYDEPKTYAAAQIIYNWDQYSQYVSPEVRQEAAKIWSDHMAKEMGFKTPSMTDEEYSYNVDRFKATYEDLEPILRMYDHAHELSGDDAQALTKQADAAAKKLGFNGEQDIRSFQSRMNIEQDARMEYQYFQPALEALYLHAGEKPTKPVNDYEQDLTYRRMNGLNVYGQSFFTYVKDYQRDAYNAIYERDGLEAANKYIESIKPLLNLQRAQEDEEYYRQFADEHPTIGSIRSIGANLLYNIPAFAEQKITGFVNMFREDPIYYDVNSDISYMSSRGEYIRSERTQNILANQERPEWMNNFLASAYGTTMSILDSAAAMGVAMLGAPGAVDLLFASSAGNSAFKDAKARGATQDQAMEYASLQAIAEALFEHISLERHIDQFVNNRAWLRDSFVAVLNASGLSEASEELATGIADAIIDVAVMGDKAEINQAAREYIANDETPNKAFWHAFSDQGKDILLEGLGGYISGGVFAAAGAGANAIRTKRAGSQLRSSLDMMSRYEDVAHILGGESMDALTRYEEKPTDTSAGKMKAVIDDAVLALYKEKDAPSVYEDREAKSAQGEAEEKAAAVTALLNGDQMNESTAQTVLDVLGKKTVQDMGYDVSSSLKFAVSYNERVAQYGIKSRTAVLQETVQKIKDAIESVPEPVEPKKAAEAVWKDPNLGFTVTEDGKRIQTLPGNMTSVSYEEQQKNNFSARTTAKAGNVTYAISGMEVRDGLDNGQTLAEIKKNMSQEHLAKAQFLEKLSKGLPGVGLVIHDTMGPHINASFDAKTNAIHVSLDSPQSVLRVLSHELTHMIKRNAIGAFGELQQAIIDEIGQERFDSMARKKADDYTKLGDPIDYDTKEGRAKAEEETVAELCEQMLSRTDWLEQFCQEHTEAARTLKDYILKIVNAIQDALKDVNNQRYGQSASEAISAQRTFEKWAAALDTALENVGKNVEADIDAEADANAEIYADESTVRAHRRLEDLQREAESEMKKGPYPRGYSTKAVDSVIDQVIQVLGDRDSFSAEDYERLRARIGQSLPVIEAWLTDVENEAKEQAALDRVAQVANEIVDAYRETEGSVDGLKELRVDIPDVIGIGPNQAGDIRSQLDKNGLFKLQAMISSALGKKVTLVTKSNAKYADALKMDELFSSMQEKYNLTDEQDFSRDALNLVDFIQGVRHTEEGTTTRMSDYGEEAREQAFLDVQTVLVGALEEAAGQKAGVAYSLDTDTMQFKTADPVTYDDQGNIIPLSERFNTKNPDIRWSLDTDALRQNAHVFTQIDGEALKAGLEQLKNVTPGKGLWALQDISRFLDNIAGGDKELRDTLTKIFETPHRQALKNYATGVGDMQKRVLDIGKRAGVCDEKGRHFDKKKSAAIQNIGEGFSNRRTNVTVRVVDADAVRVTATDKKTGKALGTKDYTFRELRGAYGREVADQLWSEAFDAAQKEGEHVDIEREVNTQPYTLADLKEAYPQDWQKLKAAADEFRTMYDEYIRNINGMLEVIYPYASKYATVDKITEAIEKKQQRLADRKAAYTVQIENLQKSLEAKEQEIASKKKQDTKAYRQLIEQRNVLDTKIAEAKAEIEEYEQNVKDQLTVMGEEKALMQNAEREGDSLGRMHRLEYRSDYFHHFTEMTSGIQNLKSIFTGNTDISPAIVGKSGQTKPKSFFAGFFLQRKGDYHTADALNGMLRYGQLAEYKLAFDPLAAYLRDVEKQVVNLDKNATNRDNLIRYIQQWTNTILGKTHTLDRALVDSGIGMRSKLFKALSWINSRVIQNTLLWNMRSALLQISNVTNATSIVTNIPDWVNGLRKWALARRGNREMQSIMNQSTFLASRYMDSLELTDSKLKSAKQFAGWLLGALDEVSAKATWWAAYTQYQRNPNAAVIRNASRSYDNAIDYADDVTRRTHAGRGVGELAPAMTSRVLNLVAPFQVEVNNTYQLLKDNVKQKNYLGLLSTGVSVFALNTIFEAIVGSTPLGFDFIRAIIDIAFGIAGDDPDDDDDDYSVGRAAQRLAGEFVGGLPYANQIVGLIGKDNAEKIIGSDTDVTRYGNTQIGLNALMNTVAGISDIGSAVTEGKNLFTGTNFISDIDDLLNIIMPMGGKQLTRTAEGLITMAKGYGGKVDKTGTEKVQFIADNDLVNWLHAGLFGKWSLTEASEYFGEERLLPKLFGAYEGPKSSLGKPVDAKEYKAALAAGIDGKEYFSLKLDLKEYTTKAGKRAEMMERGYTPEQKAKLDALLIPASSTEMKTSGAVVYQRNSKGEWEVKADYTDRNWFEISTLGSTQYEDAKGGVKAGLKPETYLTVYKKWKSIDSKDENGNTVNGLKKKRAQEYLDSLSVSPAVYEYIWTVIFGYKK